MADKQYNLTTAEAIEALDEQLAQMRAHPDRTELQRQGLTVDEAFEKGYEIAIFDLRHLTGPAPEEEFKLTIVEETPHD